MPAFQSLTVNDRAATPVAHVFTPHQKNDGIVVVMENTGPEAGNRRFVLKARKSAGKDRRTMELFAPVLVSETINGVVRSVVERRSIAKFELIGEETSTEQERKDVMGMMADALLASKVLVNDFFVKREGVW